MNYTAIGAGAAVVTIIVLLVAHMRQSQQSRLSLAADLIDRLDSQFNTEEFKEKRRIAAKALRGGNPKKSKMASIEDILDFLERVALLTRKGALDKEMVWNTFFYWFRGYRYSAKDHIEAWQKDDSTYWADFVKVYRQLVEVEKHERASAVGCTFRSRFVRAWNWLLETLTRKQRVSRGVSWSKEKIKNYLNSISPDIPPTEEEMQKFLEGEGSL